VETHGVDPNRARGQAQSAIIEAPVEARILETAAAFVHGERVSDDTSSSIASSEDEAQAVSCLAEPCAQLDSIVPVMFSPPETPHPDAGLRAKVFEQMGRPYRPQPKRQSLPRRADRRGAGKPR
jgi:hypothetical protein